MNAPVYVMPQNIWIIRSGVKYLSTKLVAYAILKLILQPPLLIMILMVFLNVLNSFTNIVLYLLPQYCAIFYF